MNIGGFLLKGHQNGGEGLGRSQKAEEGLGQMLRRLGWAGADPEKAGVGLR